MSTLTRIQERCDPVPAAEHDGYMLVTEHDDRWRTDGVTFRIFEREGEQNDTGSKVEVTYPDPNPYSYSYHRRNPVPATVTVQRVTADDSDLTVILAEAVLLAGQFAHALNEAYAEEHQRAEKKAKEERKARLRERAVENIRLQKRTEAIKEEVQWLLGQNGKLTRHGYRSTVQVRPIRSVDQFGINITTERGDYMTIGFRELKTLDIKYEGERSFTKINIPGLESFEVTEEEIEAYVNERA